MPTSNSVPLDQEIAREVSKLNESDGSGSVVGAVKVDEAEFIFATLAIQTAGGAPATDMLIRADKALRVQLDGVIQRLRSLPPSREHSLVLTKLQEGVMWLGMSLKALGAPNPYPNSKNPANTIVEPTADGLKM